MIRIALVIAWFALDAVVQLAFVHPTIPDLVRIAIHLADWMSSAIPLEIDWVPVAALAVATGILLASMEVVTAIVSVLVWSLIKTGVLVPLHKGVKP
jgi:hypothetical protein